MGRHLLAIALAGALAFANSLENGFQFDDEHSLVENPSVRSPGNIPAFFLDPQMFSRNPGSEMYRPLVLVSYALNYRLGGYAVRGYHLANISAHLLAAWAFYGVLLGLGLGRGRALVGGLLFVAHPLACEPVNYISSRSESLAALFVLGALFFHGRARGFSWPSLLCFLCGLLSKESAAVLPALLLARDWAFSPAGLRLRRHGPHWLALGLYLAGMARLVREAVAEAPVRDWAAQVCTQGKALAYYLKLLVLPHPLSVEHQFFESASPFEAVVLSSLVLLSSLALVGARSGSRQGWFWLAWIILGLLPTLVVPLNLLVAERRLYLPLAGGIGLLLWGCRSLPRPRAWAGVALALLLALTLQRNRAWADAASLWEDAARKGPLMARPQLRLGMVFRQRGDLAKAEQAYRRALELDPGNAAAHNNLGNLYRELGRAEQAEQEYQQALGLLPDYPEALGNLAGLYSQQGRATEALSLYQRALQAGGDRGELYNNIGIASARLGRWAEAEQALRRALELKPEASVCFNLGDVVENQGRQAEAEALYEEAVRLDPGYAKPYYNLARLYERQGRAPEAIRAYGEFARRWQGDPRFAEEARQRLAELERAGR